jgi:hypothetical protein
MAYSAGQTGKIQYRFGALISNCHRSSSRAEGCYGFEMVEDDKLIPLRRWPSLQGGMFLVDRAKKN